MEIVDIVSFHFVRIICLGAQRSSRGYFRALKCVIQRQEIQRETSSDKYFFNAYRNFLQLHLDFLQNLDHLRAMCVINLYFEYLARMISGLVINYFPHCELEAAKHKGFVFINLYHRAMVQWHRTLSIFRFSFDF